MAREPVGMPGDDGSNGSGFQRVDHRSVLGPRLPAVGAEVVVDVDAADRQAGALRQCLAVLTLASDAECVVLAVLADPAVDRGRSLILALRRHDLSVCLNRRLVKTSSHDAPPLMRSAGVKMPSTYTAPCAAASSAYETTTCRK